MRTERKSPREYAVEATFALEATAYRRQVGFFFPGNYQLETSD